MKSSRTKRTARILAAALVLSFAFETGAFAEQAAPSPLAASAHRTAVPFAETAPNALPALSNGPQDPQEVAAFLDELFARPEIKAKAGAIAVSVVRDGKVLASKGYGVKDKESKTPVDQAETAFRIASVSKVFTAAAVLQLVDQGKISLQDNIEKYLDGYKVKNEFDKPVTIEHLLTHTTGFEVREPTQDNFLFDPSQKAVSLKDAIFADFPPVVREPGTSYMYDNFASRLQGYIVQQASGEPFGEYVANHIFKPLGMTSTSFAVTDELEKRLAVAYDPAGNAMPSYRFSPNEIPEGSMISTAADMALFMNAFLTGGKAPDGTVILSPASLKLMAEYKSAIHGQWPDTTYGFEAPFLHGKTNGQAIIAKGGDLPGFSSHLWLLPEQKTGLFVTYNTNQDVRDDLYAAFMDHYYSGKKDAFGKEGFKPQAAGELAKFAGLYADLRSKTILTKVSVSGDGALTVDDGLSGRHELKQVDDLLFVTEKGAPLAFKTDEQGNVTYLKYVNPVSYAAKKPEAEGFPDIPADHPYAEPIHGLQALGLVTDDPSRPFEPLQTVSRGAFIHALAQEFSLPPSANPATFADTADSPYKAEIQAALELGIVTGTDKGEFQPDRAIRREEAAVVVDRLLRLSGYQVEESKTQLAPGTEPWAEASVRTMLDLKLHGPEVTTAEGPADYGSKRELNKQELAALMFALLLPDMSKEEG